MQFASRHDWKLNNAVLGYHAVRIPILAREDLERLAAGTRRVWRAVSWVCLAKFEALDTPPFRNLTIQNTENPEFIGQNSCWHPRCKYHHVCAEHGFRKTLKPKHQDTLKMKDSTLLEAARRQAQPRTEQAVAVLRSHCDYIPILAREARLKPLRCPAQNSSSSFAAPDVRHRDECPAPVPQNLKVWTVPPLRNLSVESNENAGFVGKNHAGTAAANAPASAQNTVCAGH